MSDQFKDLNTPIEISDIDFRIQSINNGKYATILAYKDARVDMNRLDQVVGVGYWKREHFDNNTRCRVSVYNKEIKEWVCKEDVGTASQTEAEKGLASDSFKRACFNLGIGRELYDYPVISIRLKDNEVQETGRDRPKYKATFDLKLKEWKWESYFEGNKIKGLCVQDDKGEFRFKWGTFLQPANPVDYTRQITRLESCEAIEQLAKVFASFTPAEKTATNNTKELMKKKLL
jgi:hypothetical protein